MQQAFLGDPTETALLVAAARCGFSKARLGEALPRVGEVPFTSERKRMTTIHRLPHDPAAIPAGVKLACDASVAPYVAFTKGAVEGLRNISSAVWVTGQREVLDQAWCDRIAAAEHELAARGMRVLGVAFRCLETLPADAASTAVEQDLIFVGMLGMMDPPRSEAASAVTICKQAGIRPIMITGDHPLTARFIARQLGIGNDGEIVTGTQLDHASDLELDGLTKSTAVYARVAPEHKLRIVQSLQRQGAVVAMTGDGVNDAPALKKANIGVAMGITGTDVAREAADMVLLDDNFTTIVAAVEEGRVIYDNIRKFIKYILATNSGEAWVMVAAPLFGMPLPLLPLQILWMNLVTDGLPALALGVEAPESDTMHRPPRAPDESIFARGMGSHVVWVGLLMGLVSLGVGYRYWRTHDPAWQTMVFTTLTLSQMAHVLAIRSERRSLFRIGVFSNKSLLAAVLLTVFLQLALIYLPPLQGVFRTTALPAGDLMMSLTLSASIFCAVEFEKWLLRRRPAQRS